MTQVQPVLAKLVVLGPSSATLKHGDRALATVTNQAAHDAYDTLADLATQAILAPYDGAFVDAIEEAVRVSMGPSRDRLVVAIPGPIRVNSEDERTLVLELVANIHNGFLLLVPTHPDCDKELVGAINELMQGNAGVLTVEQLQEQEPILELLESYLASEQGKVHG